VAQNEDRPETERIGVDAGREKVVGRFLANGSVRTDTYWGGAGRPDGEGHGHAVVDESGKVRYLRTSEEDEPGTSRVDRVAQDDRQRSDALSRRAALRARDHADRTSERHR